MIHENEVSTIDFQFRDGISGVVVNKKIQISPAEAMRKMGLTPSNTISRLGMHDTVAAAGYIIRGDLELPWNMKRHEIRMTLDAPYHMDTVPWAVTHCQLFEEEQGDAFVKSLGIDSHGSESRSVFTAEEGNARRSLDVGYNLFPIQYDAALSGNPLVPSSTFKATYKIGIDYPGAEAPDWDGVIAKFKYNGNTVQQPYAFTSTFDDSLTHTYYGVFTINVQDLGDEFTWVPGKSAFSIEFLPAIAGDPDAVPAHKLEKTFKPLFNAKTRSGRPVVCGEGFYNSNISAYGQDKLLSFLKERSDAANAPIYCNDMSLPFGGPFKINNDWKHDGHQFGLNADIRTMNSSSTEQSNYDSNRASLRIADVNHYMYFSNEAKNIADSPNIVDPIDPDFWSIKKAALVSFCNPPGGTPKAPCNLLTSMSDMTHEKILQICQWYEPSDSPDPRPKSACPDDLDLSKIKRFSKWVYFNSQGLSRIADAGPSRILMSSGKQTLDFNEMKWQYRSIFESRWPDDTGTAIYWVDGSNNRLTNILASTCKTVPDSCNKLSSKIVEADEHFNHIHVEVSN